jgi:hypothetical protein
VTTTRCFKPLLNSTITGFLFLIMMFSVSETPVFATEKDQVLTPGVTVGQGFYNALQRVLSNWRRDNIRKLGLFALPSTGRYPAFQPSSLGSHGQPIRFRPLALTNDNWVGPAAGNWSVAANWSAGVPNNSGLKTFNVFIDHGKAQHSVVTLDISPTINNLTIDNDDSLNISNNRILTIAGASIANAGTLAMNSAGNLTELIVGSANTTLSGGGTLTMSNTAANIIVGSKAGNILTNQETIQGSGNIGDNKMALVNAGTINANQPTTLTVQPSNGLSNSGTLEATNHGTLILEAGSSTATNTGTIQATTGGTLQVSGGTYTNTGQTIQDNAGTLVFSNGVVINGGSVSQTGASLLQLEGATINAPVTNSSTGTIAIANSTSNTISGTLTNPAGGQMTIGNNAALTLTGSTISNAGTLAMDSAGNLTELIVGSANTTLSGGGTLTMSNTTANVIVGSAAANILTNQETIQGSANIGNGSMGFVNSGSVLATQSAPLIIDPSNAGFNNKGTLSISSGDLMHVEGAAGTFTNFAGTTLTGGRYSVTGTLQVDQLGTTGGEILTNAANIALNGPTSSFVDSAGKNALSNLNTNATGGTFTLGPLRSFTTAGNFTNNGTLGVGSGDTFVVNGNLTNFSGTTLTGGTYDIGGTLQFNGANIATNAANITLSGTGKIVNQTSANGLANFATNATGAAFTLTGSNFTTAGNFTNEGTLTLNAGTKFTVNGNLTNFSGTTLTGGVYNDSGTLQFNGANIVTNAANITLSGTSSKITDQGGTINALANFAANSSTGAFTLAGSQSLTTSGSFTNAGTLTVAKGSVFTLNGGGSYTQAGGTTTVDGTLKSSLITAALNLNGGSLFGTGTLGFGVVDAGTLTPGDSKTSAGMLAVSGTYHQNSGGALNIAIGGTTAGTKYDQLNVTGAATLMGTLNLSLLNGFVPTVGSTFEILNASSVSGTFSTVNGTKINGSEHFVVSCDTTDCDVTVASGSASASAGTASVKPSADSSGRARLANAVAGTPRHIDLASLLGRFHRDQLPAFCMRDLTAFNHQLAEPRSTPRASFSSFFLARPERPSQFAMPASREAFGTPRGLAGRAAPHQIFTAAANHGAVEHRRLEMGFDLLSLVGNPHRFIKGLFSQPDSPNGLTYLVFNGSQ